MQISAISSAYSSFYAPIHAIGAGQNLPVPGNSNPEAPASVASAAAVATPVTGRSSGSTGTDLNNGESSHQSGPASAAALAARQLAEGDISPAKAYAVASQVAGEYGGASADGALAGQAAAAAAGLATSGTPVTMPELAAAVRSYMAMHAAAHPQAAPGVLLVA
jgi:hypothetical protein